MNQNFEAAFPYAQGGTVTNGQPYLVGECPSNARLTPRTDIQRQWSQDEIQALVDAAVDKQASRTKAVLEELVPSIISIAVRKSHESYPMFTKLRL